MVGCPLFSKDVKWLILEQVPYSKVKCNKDHWGGIQWSL